MSVNRQLIVTCAVSVAVLRITIEYKNKQKLTNKSQLALCKYLHYASITGSHDSGNSVVSPVGLVYGKPVTLDACISETAEPKSTKFGMSDYVASEFMCAKFYKNRPAGFSPAYTQHVHPPWHFFVFFGGVHESGYSPNR